MDIRQYIGAAMILVAFAALFFGTATAVGIYAALEIWGAAVLITVWIVLAVNLLVE